MDNKKSWWDILTEFGSKIKKDYEKRTGSEFTYEDSIKILQKVRKDMEEENVRK